MRFAFIAGILALTAGLFYAAIQTTGAQNADLAGPRATELTAQVASLEADLDGLLSERERLKVELTSSTGDADEMSDLVAENAALASSVEALRTEIAAKDAAIAAQTDALEAEIAALRSVGEEARRATRAEHGDAAAALAEEVETLASKLGQSEAAVRATEAEKATLVEDLSSLRMVLAEREGATVALAEEVETLEARLGQSEAAVRATEAEKAALVEELSSLRATLVEREDAAAALTEEIEAVASKLGQSEAATRAAEAEKAALVEELSSLRATLAEREDAVAALTEEIEALASKLGQSEAAARAAEAEKAALVEELSSLRATLAEREDAAAALTAEVEALASKLSQSEAAARAAEATALEKEDALARAGDRLRLLEADLAGLRAVSERHSALQIEATALRAEMDVQASAAAALEDRIAELRDDLSARDGLIAELQTQAADPAASLSASCQERSDAILAEGGIAFEPGTTTIAADSIERLAALADIAISCAQGDLQLEIEGHTDSEGGAASNLLLSDGRARTVRDALAERGVPLEAMRHAGFGRNAPLTDSATADARATNQRIVLDWEQP